MDRETSTVELRVIGEPRSLVAKIGSIWLNVCPQHVFTKAYESCWYGVAISL